MIRFDEIYRQAIVLFEDPEITNAYDNNKIQFCKLMYPFLNASISLFTNPSMIGPLLTDYDAPDGKMEVFESDGNTKKFELSLEYKDGSLIEYMSDGNIINGKIIKDDETGKTYVEFSEVPESGKNCSVQIYFVGCLNNDFKITGNIQRDAGIRGQIVSILARLLIRSWSEHTRNFLLDIQNILTDTDFKLHPASAALRSKNEWLASVIAELHDLQTKLSFNIRFSSSSNWGRRF